jgi:hypothetical protein
MATALVAPLLTAGAIASAVSLLTA